MVLRFIRFYSKNNLSKYIYKSSEKIISSKVEISFISNGFFNSPASILILTNDKRYLINCGEGFEKLFIEMGKKFTSLHNIFLTSNSPKNIIGLIGLGLNVVNKQSNEVDLCIHGFKEGYDFLKLVKKFEDEKLCQIKYHDSPIFQDSFLRVDKFTYGKDTSRSNKLLGYLFSTPKIGSKLDFFKCKELGIPSSVLMSSKMDEFFIQPYVTINENLIIDSKDVLIQPTIPNRFLLIECPSVDYIPQMLADLPFKDFNNVDGVLKLVIHLTNRDIFNSKSYIRLINQINSHFHKDKLPLHIVMDSGCNFPLSYSTFHLQTSLNNLFDSEVFPKLKIFEDHVKNNENHSPVKTVNVETVSYDESVFDVVYAEPGMQYYLSNESNKTKQFTTDLWSNLKNMSESAVINKIIYENKYSPPEFMINKMNELKGVVSKVKDSIGGLKSEKYPYITFLGTSSASPSRYRNISGILIEAYDDTNVIFDCGEGTLDRIIALFGIEETYRIIRNLRIICVSHDHLDHHSGLFSILRYREMIGQCKRSMVVVTRNVRKFCSETDRIFNTSHCDFKSDWVIIESLKEKYDDFDSNSVNRKILKSYEEHLNLNLIPVPVFHTKTSYGFVLTGEKGKTGENWKITYSGDRTPKLERLVHEGMDSDILIHEATMDDYLELMAVRKRHSTVSQAINEGIKMRAKFTILTHFSSRYSIVSRLDSKHKNVAQALDFMRINFQSCKYLRVLDLYLEYIFPDIWSMMLIEKQKELREIETQKLIGKC